MSEFLAQLLALATFFAFPAFQYFLLRRFTRNEGNPELWFLPAYNFRLVIRNIPGKKTLSELKLRAKLRRILPGSYGSSAATLMEEVLIDREEFFLFPGNDQIIICFRLDRMPDGSTDFVVTDKLGGEQKRCPLANFDKLICDYTANLENILNFDIKMAKRVEVTSKTLSAIHDQVEQNPVENLFPLDRIRNVG